MEDRIINIEKNISSLETTVKDIRYDIQRVRDQKSEIPTWLRNAAITIFIAIFAQSMTSVWWASKITSNQQQLVRDVQENTDARSVHMDNYHEIMIQLANLTTSLGLLTEQNKALIKVIHENNGTE
jgi:hypothetical protein